MKKFYDDWLNKRQKEREDKEKAVLKGVFCYKCNKPMTEKVEIKHRFVGGGHSLPAWLRGRKCSACGFTIFLPEDIKNYVSHSFDHYLLFGGIKELKNYQKLLTPEVKALLKFCDKNKKKSDELMNLMAKVRKKKMAKKPSKIKDSKQQ